MFSFSINQVTLDTSNLPWSFARNTGLLKVPFTIQEVYLGRRILMPAFDWKDIGNDREDFCFASAHSIGVKYGAEN
jgi:hypothetical protein